MTEITVDVGDLAAKEIAKRDREIARLKEKNVALQSALDSLVARFKALKKLRDTVVDTAYAIDDWYGDDD